jgi:hypothetical protein
MDVPPVIPGAWRRIDEDVDMIDQGGVKAIPVDAGADHQ